MASTPAPNMEDRKNSRLRRIGLLGAALLSFGLVTMFSLRSPTATAPLVPDSRFIATNIPQSGPLPTAGWKDRVVLWLFGFQQRYRQRHPQPLSFSFSACPVTRCSIHGLLNQCMEVNGVQYLIAREVAGGTVQFGHTNVLNGAQWVASFAAALTNGQPEWWDANTKQFRKENLVLVTNGPRTVMVVPHTMVRDVQQQP
jgi:hypothetical protein